MSLIIPAILSFIFIIIYLFIVFSLVLIYDARANNINIAFLEEKNRAILQVSNYFRNYELLKNEEHKKHIYHLIHKFNIDIYDIVNFVAYKTK